MLPTFQNSTCTCHCCTDARTNARLFSLLLKVSLTINCISLAHKAYINNDNSMVTFLFFAYFGFLALELCCAALSKLPPDEGGSTRQNILRRVVCGLYVFLAVGFMYQIGRSFPFATSLLLFAVFPLKTEEVVWKFEMEMQAIPGPGRVKRRSMLEDIQGFFYKM
ncbi:hypothetical protein Cgig2_014435 [Carnegiea gigantea]|uniref:Uncharacterized protein n=1 Tax=Carnegiea gigantea TaxID=171969 RepID=A0A9Q1JXI7_9CARY|nr:hypothetical protein Cgig2_014435 [Carnegiea gigantea]